MAYLELTLFLLKRFARLGYLSIVVATFLPITLIINILVYLNLEQVVFNFMGGFRERSANDTAYQFLWLTALLSNLAFIPIVLVYIGEVLYKHFKKDKRQ